MCVQPESMTIEQAKEKVCPFRFNPQLPESIHKLCEPKRCMRWVTTEKSSLNQPKAGYCR